jgi:hypothetical protein
MGFEIFARFSGWATGLFFGKTIFPSGPPWQLLYDWSLKSLAFQYILEKLIVFHDIFIVGFLVQLLVRK